MRYINSRPRHIALYMQLFSHVTRTSTRARTHALTHIHWSRDAHTHTRTHTRSHSSVTWCAQAHAHKHTFIGHVMRTHIRTHARTDIHRSRYAHKHTRTHTRSHSSVTWCTLVHALRPYTASRMRTQWARSLLLLLLLCNRRKYDHVTALLRDVLHWPLVVKCYSCSLVLLDIWNCISCTLCDCSFIVPILGT